MNTKTLLDYFSELTPRWKALIAIIALIIVIGVPAGAYLLGKASAEATAENKYLQERDERLNETAAPKIWPGSMSKTKSNCRLKTVSV